MKRILMLSALVLLSALTANAQTTLYQLAETTCGSVSVPQRCASPTGLGIPIVGSSSYASPVVWTAATPSYAKGSGYVFFNNTDLLEGLIVDPAHDATFFTSTVTSNGHTAVLPTREILFYQGTRSNGATYFATFDLKLSYSYPNTRYGGWRWTVLTGSTVSVTRLDY